LCEHVKKEKEKRKKKEKKKKKRIQIGDFQFLKRVSTDLTNTWDCFVAIMAKPNLARQSSKKKKNLARQKFRKTEWSLL
jgi:hypothetical protein